MRQEEPTVSYPVFLRFASKKQMDHGRTATSGSSAPNQRINEIELERIALMRRDLLRMHMSSFGLSDPVFSRIFTLELGGASGDPAATSDVCYICGNKSDPNASSEFWVECDTCGKWVHPLCDGILNQEALESFDYVCPLCRMSTCRPHPGELCPALLVDPRAPKQAEPAPPPLPVGAPKGPGRRRGGRPPKPAGSKVRGRQQRHTSSDDASLASQALESSDDGASVPPLKMERLGGEGLGTLTATGAGRTGVGRSESNGAAGYARDTKNVPRRLSHMQLHQLTGTVASNGRYSIGEYTADMHKEPQPYHPKRRSLPETDISSQHLLQYGNALFNSLRIPHSMHYANAQGVYYDALVANKKRPTCQVRQVSGLDSTDDITDHNFTSLFLYCYLEQQESVHTHIADQYPKDASAALGVATATTATATATAAPAPAPTGLKGISKRKSLIDSEKFKVVASYLSRTMPATLPVRPRLLPVLPTDHAMRVAVGGAVFDSVVKCLEQHRFRFIRALIPSATRCVLCYSRLLTMNLSRSPYYERIPYLAEYRPQVEAVLDEVAADLEAFDIDNVCLDMSMYLDRKVLLCKDLHERADTRDMPAWLTRRQWYDLQKRGVKPFPGLGLLRASLLHAIVNAELGLNILDRALGEVLTDHIIRFGMSSARHLAVTALEQSSFNCSLTISCLYQRPADDALHQSEVYMQNLQEDSDICDWDVLETPVSVVWALQYIERTLARIRAGQPLGPQTAAVAAAAAGAGAAGTADAPAGLEACLEAGADTPSGLLSRPASHADSGSEGEGEGGSIGEGVAVSDPGLAALRSDDDLEIAHLRTSPYNSK